MAKRYSRLKKTEAKRAYRSIFVYGLLTIVVMFVMIRFGTVYLFKFTNYLGILSGREVGESQNELGVTPLTPSLEPLPEFTNESEIRVKGKSKPGINIVVLNNSQKKEVIADAEGKFNVLINLSEDEDNNISAFAVNNFGQQSAETRSYMVVFDNEPPLLEIISPQPGSTYYLETERNQKIQGQTEEDATVKINGRIAIVNNENKFDFSVRLENGENKFTIIALDEAGNETEIEDYVLNLDL